MRQFSQHDRFVLSIGVLGLLMLGQAITFAQVKMDHRFTGARELMAELRDGANGGIPWYAILDANGKRLATSNHSESGDNIGYPSSDEGRAHFKRMLLETRLSMTDEAIEVFAEHLSQKDLEK